mmetsp:Transcript_15124/g.42054  ORF Transcript_15124/g.42054 Transcript_15124/m.42054 type:complete len:334 (-) Transcript_15124:453-1454(-)
MLFSKFATFEEDLPRVDGKVFAITGTTSGTGYVAAETVAKNGGEVLLLNRPSKRAEESLSRLQKAVPDGNFVPVDCDLQDFDSVRNAAKAIRDKGYKSLYCLCNNAGIMATPDKITKDGYDNQMQTNHLSHFLLTAELFPLLMAASKEYGDARIVQHSSIVRHETANKALEEKYFLKQKGDCMLGGDERTQSLDRYRQTKLANSVFNQCLHDRLEKSSNPYRKNIRSLCAHPGVSRTHLFKNFSGLVGAFINTMGFVLFQSAADGAMGILTGMMHPTSKVSCGTLYGPTGSTRLSGYSGWAIPNPPMPYEVDPEAKDMLWRTSETATGVTFNI